MTKKHKKNEFEPQDGRTLGVGGPSMKANERRRKERKERRRKERERKISTIFPPSLSGFSSFLYQLTLSFRTHAVSPCILRLCNNLPFSSALSLYLFPGLWLAFCLAGERERRERESRLFLIGAQSKSTAKGGQAGRAALSPE